MMCLQLGKFALVVGVQLDRVAWKYFLAVADPEQ